MADVQGAIDKLREALADKVHESNLRHLPMTDLSQALTALQGSGAQRASAKAASSEAPQKGSTGSEKATSTT